MILRPYQQQAVDAVIASIDSSPILVAPTGSGKTVMACEIIRRLDRRVLFVAHRRELIAQARDRLAAHGVPAGVIMAGAVPTPGNVQVASVQTLARRFVPDTDLVIIDECHHAAANGYAFALSLPRIGLTATPFRLDGKPLKGMFGEIVVAAYTDELIESGVLVRPKFFAPDSPDRGKLKTKRGDFVSSELSATMAKIELVGSMIGHWKRLAEGRRTVAFAVDVDHARMIAEQFKDAGVASAVISAETPKSERDESLAALRSGEITVIANCMVLTEGWDLPALECIIIARPTQSLGLHLQMIGRVMRIADGKPGAVVIDHAGNLLEFGDPTARIEYSLTESIDKPSESDPDFGLKRCPNCYALIPGGSGTCPECGYVFPSRTIEETSGELTEVFAPKKPTTLAYRMAFWEDLRNRWNASNLIGRLKIYSTEFGRWPCPTDRQNDFAKPSRELKDLAWRTLKHEADDRRINGNVKGWMQHRYRELFGVWYREEPSA